MADPTKEQFDTAAQKVMQSAPPGLSRDDFFGLIDKELGASSYTPDSTIQAATLRAAARRSGVGIGSLPPPTDDAGQPASTPTGVGAMLARNPLLQGAAHPTSVGDVSSLFIPDAGNMAAVVRGAKSLTPEIRQTLRGVASVIQDYDITHPAKPIGDFLKWLATPTNPAVPLAQDLGKGSAIVHGADQFRTPYSIPEPPTPNASPVKMPDGTWGYLEKGTQTLLPEGTTANVVTKSGKTWTTTVAAPVDIAADVRQTKVLIDSGVSPSLAAMKASEGNPARFAKVMAEIMKSRMVK